MKRTSIIGGEWLYYKIYTGVKTADVILAEVIKPVTENLLEKKNIQKWFFIRYADPKEHLRIRFFHRDQTNIMRTIQFMHKALTPLIENNLIWKVQVDTYQREIERYGHHSMELAEELFFNDSTMAVNMLDMIEGEEGEMIRWLFSLRSIDTLLEDFGYSLNEKVKLLQNMQENFGKEFNKATPLIKQLSHKYRENRKAIEGVLDKTKDNESEMQPLFVLLKQRSTSNQSLVESILKLEDKKQLFVSLDELLSSYIHMLMNRHFKSKQRMHEMVIYDFLYQYYKSMIARMKYSVKK